MSETTTTLDAAAPATSSSSTSVDDADLRRQARNTWLDSHASGTPLPGAELGRLFDRSDRWGRKRIQEAKAELESLDAPPMSSTWPPGVASDRVASDALSGATARDRVPAKDATSQRPRPSRPASPRTESHSPATERRLTSENGKATRTRNAAPIGPAGHAGDVAPAFRRITAAAVIVVALVAAAASYEHMRALALEAGEGWRAWLLPLSVDGMMVAASMAMLSGRRAGQPAGALAWVALLAGAATSVAANVAAAEPTLTGRAVAAWPPIALGLAYELLLQQVGGAKVEHGSLPP